MITLICAMMLYVNVGGCLVMTFKRIIKQHDKKLLPVAQQLACSIRLPGRDMI